MPYCSECKAEESREEKIIREKDREINCLKDVIVEQAKAITESNRLYRDLIDRNTELRDARDNLRRETNDMFAKSYRIKDLLKLAKECADDTKKSQRQRDISKIRVEALQDVLDILEGDEEK